MTIKGYHKYIYINKFEKLGEMSLFYINNVEGEIEYLNTRKWKLERLQKLNILLKISHKETSGT